MGRTALRSLIGALALSALIVSGCTQGKQLAEASRTPTGANTTSGAAASACANETAPLDAKAVLRCVGGSIAYVETEAGSGSGIVVDGGFLLTNAHVVDPYDEVRVVFEGGRATEHVPVAAVDLFADLALVGPLPSSAPRPLRFASGDALEKGDTVFLVGYPGETNRDDPDATISQGIVSRRRVAEPFGYRFIQTDAAIGGGQSGGALVDQAGNVVGVSGLSFAEEFALVLSGGDVQKALETLRDKKSSDYRPWSLASAKTTGVVHIETPERDTALLVVRDAKPSSKLRVQLDPAPNAAIVASDAFTYDSLYASPNAFARFDMLTGADSAKDKLSYSAGRELSAGVWEIDVPDSGEVEITVMSTGTAAVDFRYTTSVAAQAWTDDDQNEAISFGQSLDRTLRYTEWNDTFLIDLKEGQKVTVSVASPTGDMAFAVVAPGATVDFDTFIDGTGGGMLGYDEEDTFVARSTGRYVIFVVGDGVSTGYRVTVGAP